MEASGVPAAEVDGPSAGPDAAASQSGASHSAADADTGLDAEGRPTRLLPPIQLIRISLYWLGLSSIFAGLSGILGGRLQFDPIFASVDSGKSLFAMTIGGAAIAAIVQPTVGSISDYTLSRWGRRKPYILIGSVLDLLFLVAIASSNTIVAIAIFIVLLQFSSNLAQGPFQGYVPDLVPARQVGVASALVGLMQVLGNVCGFAIAAIAIKTNQFGLALVALGVLELATMLGVVLWVREGNVAKPRNGRSWLSVAREAWATDILAEHSFLWLVGSRLFVLIGGSLLVSLANFYLARSLGLSQDSTGNLLLVLVGIVAICTVATVVPAARLSDRLGRKPVIYASCVVGATGLVIVAFAPGVPVALVGVALFGISSGAFLAVDWALMTDIIPKASSGRYMGISNVATASAGVLAIAFGGTLMDLVGGEAKSGSGPRAAILLGVACFLVGAALLRQVKEPRRDRVTGLLAAA